MPKRKVVADHPELLALPELRKLWQTEGLFSDHYLKTRLAQNDWWPTDQAARPVWTFCRDLYNKRYLALARNNEAFTRQELINPVLAKLGFAWTDNLALPDQDAEPDYILFATDAEKEAVLEKDTAQRYRAAAGILEAKKLHHPLSQLSRHQQRYPHQQIRDYLQDAQVLAWGILTNGNEWRLYCREAKRHEFFAINFELAIWSLENFKFFVALFSPGAFQRDAQGRCRLDQVREQALSAQATLEEDLRRRVFTILTDLANGFASRPDNQIEDTPEGHRLLYQTCLIYLYRLLFILYAEGRLLLPIEPRTRRYYRELSLQRLKPDLRNFLGYDSRTRTRLCEDLRELFRLVNGTERAKNEEYLVPRYNGGLFDPVACPELEKWNIADADLANVLRGLMFDPPPRPHEAALPVHTVDFGDLRVQQLGSIYEGLLEHHLVRTLGGQLELRTDKAERKATGTYYTPDYIVKYIVEQTLRPLLAGIERRPDVKAGQAGSFANAVLALNVCDPAMGSGHFLVEATIHLAEDIVFHPTTRRLPEKSKDEDEIAYWRRRVVEACIYGVDLNPLAVELAKLSLWLTCIASDQPLSFLDHHLRCGNSLIGAWLDQLGSLPQKKDRAETKQMRFAFGPDFQRALAETIQGIRRIEGETSRDLDTVKAKERRWQVEILPRLAPYKKVADLWTDTFFDGPLTEEAYLVAAREIMVEAQSGDDRMQEPGAAYHVKELAKPFFHWELEFPDVFFTEDGSRQAAPGFDAVVGNPPYLLLQPQNVDLKSLVWYQQSPVAQYKVDIYHLFISRGIDLLADQGLMGYITPASFLMNNYTVNLRRHILDTCAVKELVVVPDGVFPEASVDNVVFIFRRARDEVSRSRNIIRHTVVPAYQPPPNGTWHETKQESVAGTPECLFALRAGKALEPTAECGPLGDLATVSFGMQLRDRRQYPDDVVHTTDPATLSKCHQPCWDGSAVNRYGLHFNDLYAYVNEEARRGGCWDLAVHKAPAKVLVRQIGDRPLCALDTSRNVCLNAVFMVVPKPDGYAASFLLAVMNSRFMAHYWQQNFSDHKRTFPKIKGTYLLRLPVPRVAFKTAKRERKRLFRTAEGLYERCLATNDASAALEFLRDRLRERKIDIIHDLVAFLAERMMALNQKKRAAARQFFTDLKDFHGIEARALTPKTRLDEFWKLDTPGFFAHLRQNAKALAAAKVDLNEGAQKKLRSLFEKARGMVLALEPQLAFTDGLIDQTVYRLYGLTEAEIQIVERTISPKR